MNNITAGGGEEGGRKGGGGRREGEREETSRDSEWKREREARHEFKFILSASSSGSQVRH